MGLLHDTAFRQLFAHPECMRELLTTFLPADWIAQLELATLERVNGSYASAEGAQRHSDMVWRVQMAGRWVYLYLLLEFQSAPDPLMALRMRVYVGLLQQDLAKRHELPAPSMLPPVLPMVLYTGQREWRASRSMQGLIVPGLRGFQGASESDEYILLDIPKLLGDEPLQMAQPFSALLGLRYLPGRYAGPAPIGAIGKWLRESHSEELRRVVLAWIQSSLPGNRTDSKLNFEIEEDRQMLIMRLRTPDFDTAEDLYRYNTSLNGMEFVLTEQLRKRFGSIPYEYARRLAIAIDKDFKVYADRIFDAKTIMEVFEPDPAEDE